MSQHSDIEIDTSYLLDTLRKAIAIKSILPHEESLAAFFAEEIRALGLEPEWHEVAPGRPNVTVSADLGPSDDMLILTGHLDTVGIADNWLTNPLEAVEKEGKLYGLGALDMKSGLVCALTAFKALLENPKLRGKLGKLAFAATVDEEGYGLGAKALLETHYKEAKGMIITEPFTGTLDNAIPTGLTGKVLYKLSFTGKMAHGFYPEGGINAVEEAGVFLAALDRLQVRSHPEIKGRTYATLKIEGGYEEYAVVVPEHCEVILTRLTVPGDSKASAIAEMEALAASLGLAAELKVDILEPYYDPYETQDNALSQSLLKAYKQTLGREPVMAFRRGITDANIYEAANIPTVTFGPHGSNVHACNEYVELASLEPVARIVAASCVAYYEASSET